ncbi:tropomyosin 1 isoform X9 [Rhynchophorus ferrugineus]|uniref:tropomyosin 1 isoform X9 n=1 Tax=Rhynchophorus ferrugineus TaxID=354439 RepID=UPI003FCDBF8B
MSTTRPPGPPKKRGHQHHPRNEGNRRKPILEPVVGPPLSVYSVDNVLTNTGTVPTKTLPEKSVTKTKDTISGGESSIQPNCDIPVIDLTQCDDETVEIKHENVEVEADNSESIESVNKNVKNDQNQRVRKSKKSKSNGNSQKNGKIPKALSKSSLFDDEDMSLVERPEAEGSSFSDLEFEKTDDDPEIEELSKLRCTSERTEVIAEKEMRKKGRRCADYPGLAFSSTFSSDTLMKFSIIRNEIQNIMNTQLKRAESEVAALNRRIQLLEEDLERSEERLATATAKLAEASAAADESERIRKALENRTNMEDDRVSILEQQLAQAKQIAEEADKKYEEVARKLVLMEQDLERAEERADQADSKIVELEEELRVVGNNLKSLEVSEEKAAVTREHSEDKIRNISDKLREAEARAEFAERSVQKLQKEVDRLEDDLLAEKEKNKILADEMEATLHDIQNM